MVNITKMLSDLDKRHQEANPNHARSCWFPWSHRWTKWETTEEGHITTSAGAKLGSFIKQKRVCNDCGLIEIRKDTVR